MSDRRKRTLGNGREIDVGRNHGLRKICGCPRRTWPKCSHAWHFSYRWRGRDHRFSLERHLGRRITSKSEGEAEAEKLRIAIREGRVAMVAAPQIVASTTAVALRFRDVAEEWRRLHGQHLASAKIDEYRLAKIYAFCTPGSDTPTPMGAKAAEAVTLLDIEAFRDTRKTSGLSAVAVNHDLRLLRKIFNWSIRKGLVTRTPFKIGTEPSIQLEREIPRNRRFHDPEDEERLLKACTPDLRGVVIAILETACRPGEVLSLQWRDVSLERRELVVRAEKCKTRTERLIPISRRLFAVLEMRRQGPDGEAHPPEAYVFGDETGWKLKAVRTAWDAARTKAGLGDFHLADLRHEAASRFDEAGMPINFVSKLLGHTNLLTTSRYLNVHRRGLHMAMEKYEESRRLASSCKNDLRDDSKPACEPAPASSSKSLVS